jgi:Bacteriocin-protection, YdeI or OmpD-Associated/Domain of unknown function (DUF1905)
MRFSATVESSGMTATAIEVPVEVVERFGSRRPKVVATINGYTWRTSVASMGGRFMLGISGNVRSEAGIRAGDRVKVDLVPDTQQRTVDVPADFAAALHRQPAARPFFDGPPYSQQRWFVDGIESAKEPETRTRRIDAAVVRLRQSRGQR